MDGDRESVSSIALERGLRGITSGGSSPHGVHRSLRLPKRCISNTVNSVPPAIAAMASAAAKTCSQLSVALRPKMNTKLAPVTAARASANSTHVGTRSVGLGVSAEDDIDQASLSLRRLHRRAND